MIAYVAAAIFLGLTGWVFYCVGSLRVLLYQHADPRFKRRLVSRAFLATGLWEWSVAGFMISEDTWSGSIPLLGVGALLLAYSRWPIMAGVR